MLARYNIENIKRLCLDSDNYYFLFQLDEKAKKDKKDKAYDMNKRREARKKKEKKNKEDKSETDTNHLQVLSAVDGSGSNSASSTSLKSVGNGHLKNNALDITPDDKTSIETNSKSPNNSKKTEDDSGTGHGSLQGTTNEKADIKRRKSDTGEEEEPKGDKPPPDSIHTTLDSGMGSSEKLMDGDDVQELKPSEEVVSSYSYNILDMNISGSFCWDRILLLLP